MDYANLSILHSVMTRPFFISTLIIFILVISSSGQSGTCPYPTILLHGWTGSNESWADFYENTDMISTYGGFDENDHVGWVMPNATNTHDYYTDCWWWDPFCLVDCEYIVDNTKNDDLKGPDGAFNSSLNGDDVNGYLHTKTMS